ncbi:MAG: phospholipase D-like domain-containing protein [Candidatus Methylophosphatis roskildensis]|uniref:phospholipase D n=1 Tax=Candidatus Methylophosphatis roskildensis TaxID=2899263 RepID=A0A9D7E147_9PROT|nr:phospholipase D family protein [Candidatus Methylophosphatis roskildensis]MBK7662447.1 phospholipase D family protein [Sterolibacteriaceae bacterium]
MQFAEDFAFPVEVEIGRDIPRTNDFKDLFYVRWGAIRFDAFWGEELNLKVVLKVYRADGTCEQFIADTDAYDVRWDRHKRATRDFYVHPFSMKLGHISHVGFSFLCHLHGRSIRSRHEYIFMDGHHLGDQHPQRRHITLDRLVPNTYRTHELDAGELQRDVDWFNHHFESLNLVPKFTKGQPYHPYHPKPYIHERIDATIHRQLTRPERQESIKVCVDCIDDADFISHLIHAHACGVRVQCIVDWRKMALTNSDNYVRLKRSGIDLLGVFCTPKDRLIEVAPDMHNKFIIFGDEDVITGSFNITFDRWWANWESGMSFHSRGVCRLFDNIFQSVRGGVIQRYGIDPLSHFNLLYTFGRGVALNGRYYRPHHAIVSEVHRARHSIKLCSFLIGELQGEHHDSVIDALIHARRRGVDVKIILNGHLARQGSPGKEHPMAEELQRPLLPAVTRLKQAGIPVALAYGLDDFAVPYSPIHSKYCIFDDYLVLDGSFNWYNASVFSHDIVIIAANREVAEPYLFEFEQILRRLRIYW